MVYIYDILLSFNEKIYECFEWNNKSKIDNMKKIKLLKVKYSLFNKILRNNIIFDKSFLDKIHNTSELYLDNYYKKEDYYCLISDGKRILGLKIDKKGRVIGVSKMLFEEEFELFPILDKLKVLDISYKIVGKCNRIKNYINSDYKLKCKLKKEIEDSYNSNFDKLKYMYIEIFDKEIDSKDIMYRELLNSLIYVNYKHYNLYNYLTI